MGPESEVGASWILPRDDSQFICLAYLRTQNLFQQDRSCFEKVSRRSRGDSGDKSSVLTHTVRFIFSTLPPFQPSVSCVQPHTFTHTGGPAEAKKKMPTITNTNSATGGGTSKGPAPELHFPPITRDHILHCSYDSWFPKLALLAHVSFFLQPLTSDLTGTAPTASSQGLFLLHRNSWNISGRMALR